MSTSNVVFKINEIAKEFGFTLKEKQKNYKTVYLFFSESSLVAFQVSHCLAHLQLRSIDRNIHRSFFIITGTFGSLLRSEQQE